MPSPFSDKNALLEDKKKVSLFFHARQHINLNTVKR
jgi:hypothetical protein